MKDIKKKLQKLSIQELYDIFHMMNLNTNSTHISKTTKTDLIFLILKPLKDIKQNDKKLSKYKNNLQHISFQALTRKANKKNSEIGIVGLNVSDKQANAFYKHYKRMHMSGYIFRNRTRWRQLKQKVYETLQHIKESPDMGRYWNSKINNKKEFLTIFYRSLIEGTRYLTNNQYLQHYPKFSIQWVRSHPTEIAVYDPENFTLYLHEWMLTHFRRCDVLIIGLHEILGHHLQESTAISRKIETTTREAESCGMMCEEIISKHLWSTPRGNVFDLSKCMYQWKLNRLVRAQVDLRLHSRDIQQMGVTVQSLWDQDSVLRKHITPLPSETIRCASNPAQAQAYVLYKQKSTKYCHA